LPDVVVVNRSAHVLQRATLSPVTLFGGQTYYVAACRTRRPRRRGSSCDCPGLFSAP
jgi:hypothetical protein